MSGATGTLLQRIAAEHAVAAAALPALTRPAARQALGALLARGLPTAREENWRYANLRPLDKAAFAPAQPGAAPALPPDLPPQLDGHLRYVFVDGRLAAGPSTAAAGLRVATGQAPDFAAAARGTDECFGLLNDAFATDGAAISVAPGAEAAVEVIFAATGRATAYPRLAVQLGANARLRLVERHLAPADATGLTGSAVDIELADGATLDHCRLQQAGAGATWLDTLAASVGHAASYRTHVLQLGGLAARTTSHVVLAAPGAALEFNAAALADERQVLDAMVVVDHRAPQTRTEQNFRGIAGSRARIGFNGRINVGQDAPKADSAQSLRGLLAGPEAEIDLRPQLEIYTDDVRCSHGATTGKLDENMLFYLLSRGLAPEVAQRLLKWAFLGDVVSRLTHPQLRQQAQQALVGHMRDAAALKELI